MKATIEIPDGLFEQVEEFAHKHNLTLDDVIETGLRQTIAGNKTQSEPFQMRDASVGGQGMVKDYTWAEIKEIMYEGRGA